MVANERRPGRAGSRRRGSAAARKRHAAGQAHRDRTGELDPGAAHLAVALREVEIADREQRAGHRDGQQQPAARDQLPDVEVAAQLPRRDRPQPARSRRRQGRLRERVGDGPARRRDRLLARVNRRQQLVRRGHADHASERVPGHGDTGQLRRPRDADGDLPGDDVRVREEIGQEPEAGDDRRHAGVRGLVREELDLEHVARLRALDMDRAGERVAEPEVEATGVRVGAAGRQLASDAVLALEPQLLARPDAERRLEIGVPAVVHQTSSASSAAAPRQAAASSSVHRRGVVELVHGEDRRHLAARLDGGDDLRRHAAVGLEHPLEGRVVVGGAAVVLDDLAALAAPRVQRVACSGRRFAPPAATRPRARAPRP